MLEGTDINVISMKEACIDIDIEENGKTFAENAIIKAEALRDVANEIVMADDSGLEIDAMGSMCSTIRVVVDELRENGEKVGLLRIRSYRPFPYEEINEIVKNADKLAVLDKNVTFGIGGALFTDICAKCDKDTYGFILGLGGRDIIPDYIKECVELTKSGEKKVTWIGLKEDE